MTADSGDLLAWLDRAISERETAAREACDGGEGRWHSGWCPDDELEEGETNGAGVTDERDRTVVYDEGRPSKAQSVHIALNDPASVLLRCATDRRLIAEHGPFTDRDQGCKGCGLDAREELITEYYEHCPVLVRIAEGYGWTGSEQRSCGDAKRHPSHTFLRMEVLFQCPGVEDNA